MDGGMTYRAEDLFEVLADQGWTPTHRVAAVLGLQHDERRMPKVGDTVCLSDGGISAMFGGKYPADLFVLEPLSDEELKAKPLGDALELSLTVARKHRSTAK